MRETPLEGQSSRTGSLKRKAESEIAEAGNMSDDGTEVEETGEEDIWNPAETSHRLWEKRTAITSRHSEYKGISRSNGVRT